MRKITLITIERKVIGRVFSSDNNIIIFGTMMSNFDYEKEFLYSELPSIGVTIDSNRNKYNYYIVFHSTQENELFYMNTIEEMHESNHSMINELTTERKFIGVKLGELEYDEITIGFTREQLQINSILYVAETEEIEKILTKDNYFWLYSIENLSILKIQIVKFASYLKKYINFRLDFFVKRLIDIMIHAKIPMGQLLSILNDIYFNLESRPLGFIINDAKDVEMLFLNIKNLKDQIYFQSVHPDTGDIIVLEKIRFQGDKLILKKKQSDELGLSIGMEVNSLSKELISELIEKEARNGQKIKIPLGFIKGVQQESQFPLVIIPGITPLSCIISGNTRTGKSALVTDMIIQFVRLNRFIDNKTILGNKIGTLVFDKQGEYSETFSKIIEKNGWVSDYVEIINPVKDLFGRICLQDIPINYFIKEEEFISKYLKIVNFLVTKRRMNYPHSRKGEKMERRLSFSLLNKLLYLDNMDYKEIKDETKFTKPQIDAVIRRLQKIKNSDYLNILQMGIKKEDQTIYELNHEYNLLDKLWFSQSQGKITIINFEDFERLSSEIIRFLYNILLTRIDYIRNKDRGKLGELKFRETVPIYFIVNEEASSELSGKSDPEEIQVWKNSVTKSSKNLIGNIFIFQTTQKIDPIILSQLSGFVSIFKIPLEEDLNKVIKSIAVRNASQHKDKISKLNQGEALMTCEALDNEGFYVKVINKELLIENIENDQFMFPEVIH